MIEDFDDSGVEEKVVLLRTKVVRPWTWKVKPHTNKWQVIDKTNKRGWSVRRLKVIRSKLEEKKWRTKLN